MSTGHSSRAIMALLCCTAASASETSLCETSYGYTSSRSWPLADHSCTECSASFPASGLSNYFEGTCSSYCEGSLGLSCVAAWEEGENSYENNCVKDKEINCGSYVTDGFAICQCGEDPDAAAAVTDDAVAPPCSLCCDSAVTSEQRFGERQCPRSTDSVLAQLTVSSLDCHTAH